MIERLTKLKESLLILESGKCLFPIQERLKMAATIRNAILNDTQLAELCDSNMEMSEMRRDILERAKSFIDTTIKDVLDDNPKFPNNENLLVENYSESRKELSDIVIEELSSPTWNGDNSDFMSVLPEWNSHRETLHTIEEHCTKNRYTVLLMGEYQTGKTTTLDALCEGRHIGKIGVGSATSAVPVSVSYCEKEYINVGRKSDEDLKRILSCLNEHLEGFNENFELNDPNSRAQWLEELENFRQSRECPKDVRQLAVCSFILKYYDTPKLDKIISDIELVTDASKYTYFPEKLNDRWSKDGISAFGIHETVFVFISHLDCYIDSPTLKRLGCTLIDCPGLFNNKYDTEVTTQIMSKVHAILYLLPYEKGIGEDVCESLYKIQSDFRDVHRKLFIANNLSSKKDNLFLEDNINEVKRLFGEDKHVTCYDAHLAYLGMFKQSLEAGLLKTDDVTHFCRPVTRLTISRTIQTIKFADFEDAWKYHTRGYDVEIDSDEFIKASQINQLIDDLRSFIEANEAYTVIFSDGINKMQEGLTKVRNVLHSKFVEPYCLGSDELIRLWQERLAKVKEFDKKADDIIKKHLFATRNNIDALSSRLSDDVYGKLFTESIYDELSKRIAATIYENKYTVFKLLRKEEELKKFISPLIEEDIASIVESRLNYWNSIMSNGSDTSFKDIFEPEMELLEGRLLREWEQTYSKDKSFFNRMTDFLNIPRDSAGFAIKCTEKQSASVSIKAKDIMPELLAEVAVIASSIAMAIASYICFLISCIIAGGGPLIANPVGIFVAMIVLLGGGVVTLSKGPEAIKNEFVKRISKKIREELNKQGIASKFKKMITSEINRRLESFGEKLHVDFEKLDNERDLATSRSDEVIEDACFTSSQIIANINSQLKLYKCFKEKHVEHDKA